jgi:hypothetical protein
MKGYPIRFWVAAAAIVATFVGLIGPWAKALFVSLSGLETDDGKVLAVVALLAAAFLVLHASQTNLERRPAWPLVLIMIGGIVIAAVAFADASDIQARVEDSEGLATVGWGVWLDGAAGVALGAAALFMLRFRNEPYGKRAVLTQSGTALALPPQPPAQQIVPTPPPGAPAGPPATSTPEGVLDPKVESVDEQGGTAAPAS